MDVYIYAALQKENVFHGNNDSKTLTLALKSYLEDTITRGSRERFCGSGP